MQMEGFDAYYYYLDAYYYYCVYVLLDLDRNSLSRSSCDGRSLSVVNQETYSRKSSQCVIGSKLIQDEDANIDQSHLCHFLK